MKTRRLTVAQALVSFLKVQYVERDGRSQPFFAGCFGIFGHGNVAGLGEALRADPGFRYYPCRNEQAMVHTAAAYARMKNRLGTFACTTSTGPGATNMVTGAAGATINRVPVLLLPGDVFARRQVAPVLQQLESESTGDISVNDCFKPVSRYWDRVSRPEQLLACLPEAMRVLTSPSQTGAVTLCLPQDVQAEAFDWPETFFEQRVWTVPRTPPDAGLLGRAVDWIRQAKRPLLVAGGGVLYSEASGALARLVEETGIPVAETQAGKGSLPFDHPASLGAVGVTGTPGAIRMAQEADLVIGVGTRYSDFTTASKTGFGNPDVRFVNLNVAEFDAHKHAALPLVADARVGLEVLGAQLGGYRVDAGWAQQVETARAEWATQTEQIFHRDHGPPVSQGEVIGLLDAAVTPKDVVVCAAGSLPGDLHKLWRTRQPGTYHVEYGYSCMGYEIAGGLGVKLAAPDREVFVMVGDGSYLMMAQELVTAVQEGVKLVVVLLDNRGYASIGALSESLGTGGFGTRYRYRGADGQLSGDVLPEDLAANAESLGARVLRAGTRAEVAAALQTARDESRTTVIAIPVDREARVGGHGAFWDVPVAEVSTLPEVQAARVRYEAFRKKERWFL
jgi:3D-(3,5/4)-trihydroxycyclohexane-1,2-dione acylhydrolase (decyclizing)